MALSASVVDYVNRNMKALELQGVGTTLDTSDNCQLRGYTGFGERISGEEADKRIMRMMDGW